MSEYIDQKRKTLEMIFKTAISTDSRIVEKIKNMIAQGATKKEILNRFEDIMSEQYDKLFSTMSVYKAKELKAIGVDIDKSKTKAYLLNRFIKNTSEGFPHYEKIPHPQIIVDHYQEQLEKILTDKTTLSGVKKINEELEELGERRIAGTILNTEQQRINRQYEREIVAEEIQTELYLYEGPIIETSREFCRVHVGQVKTENGWNSLDNGAGHPGPIMEYAGGWNCQHMLMAITQDMRDRYEEEGII